MNIKSLLLTVLVSSVIGVTVGWLSVRWFLPHAPAATAAKTTLRETGSACLIDVDLGDPRVNPKCKPGTEVTFWTPSKPDNEWACLSVDMLEPAVEYGAKYRVELHNKCDVATEKNWFAKVAVYDKTSARLGWEVFAVAPLLPGERLYHVFRLGPSLTYLDRRPTRMRVTEFTLTYPAY